MEEWISVKDRLPEPEFKTYGFSKDVLVYDKVNGQYVAYYNNGWQIDTDHLSANSYSYSCSIELEDEDQITHWKPLGPDPIIEGGEAVMKVVVETNNLWNDEDRDIVKDIMEAKELIKNEVYAYAEVTDKESFKRLEELIKKYRKELKCQKDLEETRKENSEKKSKI